MELDGYLIARSNVLGHAHLMHAQVAMHIVMRA